MSAQISKYMLTALGGQFLKAKTSGPRTTSSCEEAVLATKVLLKGMVVILPELHGAAYDFKVLQEEVGSFVSLWPN